MTASVATRGGLPLLGHHFSRGGNSKNVRRDSRDGREGHRSRFRDFETGGRVCLGVDECCTVLGCGPGPTSRPPGSPTRLPHSPGGR